MKALAISKPGWLVGGALATAVISALYGVWKIWKKINGSDDVDFSQMTWEEVGKLDSLFLYPCKSAKGVKLEKANAEELGLTDGHIQDRSFVIVNEDNRMVTGRQVGKLVTIAPSYKENLMTLTSMDGSSITFDLKNDVRQDRIIELNIWGTPVKGVDCGNEVADWLSKILYEDNSTNVRLAFRGDIFWERVAVKPKFVQSSLTKNTRRLLYADGTAYMLANKASLDDLNTRTSHPVPMDNFRPNIVVEGPKPYDEDEWEYVRIGDRAIFRVTKPCERCVFSTVNPKTGERMKEPIETLLTYRRVSKPDEMAKLLSKNPIFGMSCGIDQTGPLKLGDPVYVVRNAQNSRWKIGQ